MRSDPSPNPRSSAAEGRAVYVPSAGESVHQAAAAALARAAAGGAAVTFELHRTTGEARPGESPGAVALRWYERRRQDAVGRLPRTGHGPAGGPAAVA